MTDQVPDNVNAAMWTLQRLTKAPKLSAATLKAFQAVPIANAALWVKCSGLTMRGAKRDALTAEKVSFMVDEFWTAMNAEFKERNLQMPSWMDADHMKYTTLKSKYSIGSKALATATLNAGAHAEMLAQQLRSVAARASALTQRYKSQV